MEVCFGTETDWEIVDSKLFSFTRSLSACLRGNEQLLTLPTRIRSQFKPVWMKMMRRGQKVERNVKDPYFHFAEI